MIKARGANVPFQAASAPPSRLVSVCHSQDDLFLARAAKVQPSLVNVMGQILRFYRKDIRNLSDEARI